jgi:formate/nitrite transporter FocA (FNT family)
MKTHEEKQAEQRADRTIKLKVFYLGMLAGVCLTIVMILINK